jgi:hypothetical protein
VYPNVLLFLYIIIRDTCNIKPPRTCHTFKGTTRRQTHENSIKELHEDKDMKAGERREVVDRASQKGLPRISFNKTRYEEQPNLWAKVHTSRWHYASQQQVRGWEGPTCRSGTTAVSARPEPRKGCRWSIPGPGMPAGEMYMKTV